LLNKPRTVHIRNTEQLCNCEISAYVGRAT